MGGEPVGVAGIKDPDTAAASGWAGSGPGHAAASKPCPLSAARCARSGLTARVLIVPAAARSTPGPSPPRPAPQPGPS